MFIYCNLTPPPPPPPHTHLVHPRVRSYPDSVSVMEGENKTLTCVAEGYPQPDIAWFKDGVQLDVGVSLISHSRTTVQSILHINSSGLNDTGQYQCQASSTFNLLNMSSTAISEETTVIIFGQLAVCHYEGILNIHL